MLSSVAFSVLALLVFACGVSATGFDWLDTLPDCWQECLSETGSGCDSATCICKASNLDGYLPDAVSCARTTCDANDWTIDPFLVTLQAYCGFVGNDIPESIISSAQCAATETSKAAKPTSTRQAQHSQKSQAHRTKSNGGDEVLTSIYTTTITQTTTDSDGATLQIIIPVVMGPSTVSYGSTITSTLDGKASATDSASSDAASPSPTAATSAPVSTPTGQGQVGSSTTSSKKAEKTSSNNNNGSPFENMQAGASRWKFSGGLVGVGVLAGLFMRL
ncbi:uncharacterized protein BDR25DRAFT_304699 [Lindgomyces ingoldianus]|uniref:Uncharacterized protein n=1 Tax=Lindgomyces ingoldianus TaxID=673940 RepID=A0ACB6QP21_9PLEO|nr:uncharacterized protein BDR25DRAFT_304699 [Lindgomyces ingoldianus]KAF2468656.1 hypothetical protein BDR25DRAFT_304699 [Lindgomyces ingoldianus]